MNRLGFASITQLQKLLQKNEISSQELLDYFLTRLHKHDTQLQSTLEIFDAHSIKQASASTGKLHAIPGLIKDNISQKGRQLTCASKILENFTAIYDATAIERLKKQGAFLVGRANLDEFAMGSSTETSAYKKTKNPWNFSCVPGGSSGGSVAAVAAGLVPWALGSETGGSVRQPAAFCGIVGLKPTYGLISRKGLVAYASSLDQIGIATRTVRDNAIILSIIAGNDAGDSSSLPVGAQDYTNMLTKNIDGLKIGIIDNALQAEGIEDDVKKAIETAIKQLQKLKIQIKHVTIPSMDFSAAAYFIISRAEAASNLARYDGVRYGFRAKNVSNLQDMYAQTRHDGFGHEVKARIMVGNYVLSAGHAKDFYGNAQKVQQLICAEFLQQFQQVDLLLAPTTAMGAFKIGAFDANKLQMDLQDYFTCPVNLAGIPAISIPCGFTKDQLPIGMQLIGPRLSESLLYAVAHAYEQNTEWHTMHPQAFVD